MDIVDAQLHMGRGAIATTLAAMDALGIVSIVIDEFWHEWAGTHPSHIQPGHLLPNGAWRAAWPTATEAAMLHPDRFSYLVRIDAHDPDLEAVMRFVGSSPNARAVRIQPVWTLAEAAGFAAGSHDRFFDLAQDIGLPVCMFVPGEVEAVRRYAVRYPRLRLGIDHCGMGYAEFPDGRSEAAIRRVTDPAYFRTVLSLADCPNVYLKWSHAQDRFGVNAYPYTALQPHLRQAIAAFGVNRLMWASDKSVIPDQSWADLLYGLRDDPNLSENEKAWILGRSARAFFDWPIRL